MKADNLINIDDARELRALGLPILPIVDMQFSNRAERLFFDGEKARANFYLAFRDYCKCERQTAQGFYRIRKQLDKIAAIGHRATRFTSRQEGEAECRTF